MASPISVTLLTGFLGSGKTTLINHFLRHHSNQKVVIIENEFGALNIDGTLLHARDGVRVIELSNGCVCCSVRGEFSAALKDMLLQRENGAVMFDHVIIETTGLADPAPIIQTFFVEETLRESLQLDAVITLVDGEHILQQLDEHPVAAAQIGFADRILLTKNDRIDEHQCEQVLERVHRINPKAQIYQVKNGICSSELWLNLNAFAFSDELYLAKGTHILHAHPIAKSTFKPFRTSLSSQKIDDAIQAHVLEAGVLNLQKAGAFMEHCIERYGNDMLRYKGVFAIADHPCRLIVQGVHRVTGFDYGSSWQKNEVICSQLIIIGRYLPIDELRVEFMQTMEQR